MNQLTHIQGNKPLFNKLKQIILITILGLYAIYMEWKSFGFVDFNDINWLAAVLILSAIIWKSWSQKKTHSPEILVAFGVLCWSFWRFLMWIFASRSSLIIVLSGMLTMPVQKALKTDITELIMIGLTITSILLSIWAIYWVYKNFDVAWLRRKAIYWIFLFAIVTLVATYSQQQEFKNNCFGLNTYTSSLFCDLQNNLGVIGSIWITIAFLLWGLTFALKQSKTYGTASSLWVIALEPVWIEIFFNPSRILGVLLFKEIRTPGENIPFVLIESNMQFLNILPLFIFFILIPVGLFVLKSEKLRAWWMILISLVTFSTLLSVLFYCLEIGKSFFSYSTAEQIVFILMALQLWIPLLIATIISNKAKKEE